MKNKLYKTLLFILFCTTQISNLHGMQLTLQDQEQLELPWEIPGKIVTTLLDLYLDELEDALFYQTHQLFNAQKWDTLLYESCAKKIFEQILYWIQCTNFNPVQKNINFNGIGKHGETLLHHTTKATFEHTIGAFQPTTRTSTEYKHITTMYARTFYLLNHKANPNIQNKDGQTAFLVCLSSLGKRDHIWPEKKTNIVLEEKLVEHFFIIGKADPNQVGNQDAPLGT